MKRPTAVNVAMVLLAFLGAGLLLRLRLLDSTSPAVTRHCYEGYLILDLAGFVAILIRAKGSRLFSILLFVLYLGFYIYDLADLLRSGFTIIALVTTLCVTALLAWLVLQFFREP